MDGLMQCEQENTMAHNDLKHTILISATVLGSMGICKSDG